MTLSLNLQAIVLSDFMDSSSTERMEPQLATMSGCPSPTAPLDTYRVIVQFPKPLRTRIRETWNNWRRCCTIIFDLLIVGFLIISVPQIMGGCHMASGMALESLSIRDMAVYQTTTTANSTSPWQVDSAFNVTLSAWNPNTIAGCFTTYERVIVRVLYKSQTILQQEIPLRFNLKPRGSRPVTLELRGEHFQLRNSNLGPVMKAEVHSDNITLEVYFDAWCLRNDRQAGWLSYGCLVVSKTPNSANSSSSSHLLDQLCH